MTHGDCVLRIENGQETHQQASYAVDVEYAQLRVRPATFQATPERPYSLREAPYA